MEEFWKTWTMKVRIGNVSKTKGRINTYAVQRIEIVFVGKVDQLGMSNATTRPREQQLDEFLSSRVAEPRRCACHESRG